MTGAQNASRTQACDRCALTRRLGGGDPVSVKTVGYAMWDADDSERLTGDVPCIENIKVAGVTCFVIREDKDVSVILGGVGVPRNKQRLAHAVACPEGTHLAGTALQIMLVHGGEDGTPLIFFFRPCRCKVTIAVLATETALVDAWELAGSIIKRLGAHTAAG